MTSRGASAANARPDSTVTPKFASSSGRMPISRNSGLAASSRVVPMSTPVAAAMSWSAAMRARVAWSTLLLRMSDTPRWATVKSARPVCMIASSDPRRLWLTMLKVTTVSTPIATASEVRTRRTFFTATLWITRPTNVNPLPATTGVPGSAAIASLPSRRPVPHWGSLYGSSDRAAGANGPVTAGRSGSTVPVLTDMRQGRASVGSASTSSAWT